MVLIFSVIIISLISQNQKLTKNISIQKEENQQISIELQASKFRNEGLRSDIVELEGKVEQLEKDFKELKELRESEQKATQKTIKGASTTTAPTRGGSRIFKASAYDLSYASCGKEPSHPGYGITSSGFSLKGKTLEDRYIAVDRNVIPLGSEVHIEFFEPYTHLTGSYTAVDTGGAIKGNRVDIFFGSGNVNAAAMAFGRRDVRVTY